MRILKFKVAMGVIGIGAFFAASASAQMFIPLFYDGPEPALASYEPAVATLNEAAIDAIFAVNAPVIDVRYLPTITVFVDPAIASDVNTAAEFNTLAATAVDATPIISMWFVDNLSTCGTTENSPGIAGCAGGTVNVIDSPVAQGSFGTSGELQAHELGHNLGLTGSNGHTPNGLAPAGNLMDPILNNNTTLTLPQQAVMAGNLKIQTDGGGQFIQVRPIIVAAAPVPEPSAMALLSLAGLLLFGVRRR